MLDSLLEKELQEADELEAVFLQALYWSIGAGLLEDGRIKFDQQVKGLAAMQNVNDDDKTRAGLGNKLCLLLVYRDRYAQRWMDQIKGVAAL